MPSRRPSLTPVLGEAPVGTMAELLERLTQLEAALPVTDGVHWFARLYSEATGDIQAALAGGEFEHPTFLEGLGVFCGNAFLAGLAEARRGGGSHRAWAPLFAARGDPDVAPVQFAIAGLNAHMNHDLAAGLAAEWQRSGIAPGASTPERRDFDRLDTLIAATEKRVKPWLLTGAVKEVEREFRGADDVVANFAVARAHQAAWTAGALLWHLRGEPVLAGAYDEALDRGAGLASRLLLVPTGVG